MKRIDIIEAAVAFVLIVLMFGALGGVDSERLSLLDGISAVLVIFCGLVANVRICDRIRIKTKKQAERRNRVQDEMKKGA